MLRLRYFPQRRGEVRNLPSSSALDSPSVISKLATPQHAIKSDMSQVIDDATSAMNSTHDDASTLLDDDVPLGQFLDEQIARVRQHDIVETDDELETENLETPIRDFLACNDRDDPNKLLCKLKEKSLNARMKCDSKFATSPIFMDDEDYEFSVDLELITLVESDPFLGYKIETVVALLTKLNDIATLFSHDEKIDVTIS